MSAIRFSVVVTCYNQRDFIRDAVDSALFQSVAGKEVIVVDDASTDGSRQILARYEDAIRLAPLRSNLGAVGARNHGASLARGAYLVFLDGDDALRPWALEVYDRIVDARQPEIILSRLLFFERATPPVSEDNLPRKIEIVSYENFIEKDRTFRASASAIVVRRKTFDDVQGWSSDVFPLEDVDLVAKLGCSGRAIQIVSPATILYRIHGANTIHQVPRFMSQAHRLIQKVRSGEYRAGRSHRSETKAFIGGPVAFWVKRAYNAGLYREALTLMADGWSLILAALVRKFTLLIRKKRPVETIKLSRS